MLNKYTQEELKTIKNSSYFIKYISNFRFLVLNLKTLFHYIIYFFVMIWINSVIILIKYFSIIFISVAFYYELDNNYLYSIIHIHLLFMIEIISFPILFSTKNIENIKLKFLFLFLSMIGFFASKILLVYSFFFETNIILILWGIFSYFTIFLWKTKEFYLKLMVLLENIIIFVGLYLKFNYNYFLVLIFLLLNIVILILFYTFYEKIKFIEKINNKLFLKKIFFIITCILLVYFQLNIIVANYIIVNKLLSNYIIFINLNKKNILVIITYLIIELLFSTIFLIKNNYLKKISYFKKKKSFIYTNKFNKLPNYIYIFLPPDKFIKQNKKTGIIINEEDIDNDFRCLHCNKKKPDIIMNNCGHFIWCAACLIKNKNKMQYCPKCNKLNTYYILLEKNILFYMNKYIKF